MHGINGLMYCNWEVDTAPGQKIRMLLTGYGSEEGIHSPRVIGQVSDTYKSTYIYYIRHGA